MHRSDFCVTASFRDLFLFRDFFLMRQMILLVVVSMVLFALGRLGGIITIHPFPLLGQPSLANVIGGFVFGIGMVLASGCVIGQPAGAVCTCAVELGEVRAHADGSSHGATVHGRDMQVVASKIADETGRHVKTVMLFTDISAQKAIERHLQLYATVFGNIGEGVLITDADNRIIEVNDAVSRITGYTRAELPQVGGQ
ncbi:MAG: YeeE/YedE thiosulfate transporter family protein [Rhodocyclaceae bacterium]|nr:YeeE/YedE thiosulfate transporter family protein [Rhodocyclaceae bacterium]